MLLRLNTLHLLQAVSPNSIGLDIGVPARGWTGEAYQGHIFWDELLIFPFFNYRMPEVTRSLLHVPLPALDEARVAAARQAFGRHVPVAKRERWAGGDAGAEPQPPLARWMPDNSYRQRHVGSAIAYNVWQYYQVTHDLEFLMPTARSSS